MKLFYLNNNLPIKYQNLLDILQFKTKFFGLIY
jgi:hypothetical protein